jgi:hypothetical protein
MQGCIVPPLRLYHILLLQISIVRQMTRAASQPFQTQLLCPLIAHNRQYNTILRSTNPELN